MSDAEFNVKDALQDMFYSMAERMDKDHVWSAKELVDMGDLVFSDDRHRLSDYVDRLVALAKVPEDASKDVRRMNFLADANNFIANVQLPREIVERNLDSMRNAIDEAICFDAIKAPMVAGS